MKECVGPIAYDFIRFIRASAPTTGNIINFMKSNMQNVSQGSQSLQNFGEKK